MLSGSNFVVRVRQGLDVSGDASIPKSVQTPNGPVILDFSGLGPGTSNVTDIEGSVNLSITGFGSLQGNFGFQSYTDPTTGLKQIAVGATNVTAKLGTSSTYLQLLGGSLGLVIQPGPTTATQSNTLNGTTSSISLQKPAIVSTVVVASSVTGTSATTSANSALAGSVVVSPAVMAPYIVVGAHLEINQGQTDQELVTVSAVTTTTFTATFAQAHNANFTIADAKILVAGTDYTLSTDASDLTTINFTSAPAAGTTINTTYTGASTYALEATATSVSLIGVTGLTLSAGNLMVEAREGLDLSQAAGLPVIHTPGGNVTLDFSGLGPGTGNVFDVQGQVNFTVGTFVTLSGAFGFQSYSNATDTYLAMGLDGGVSLTAGTASLSLSNVSIAILVDQGSAGTTYAIQASEGASAADTNFSDPGGFSLSASNLLVLVDQGLDLSTYPSGVPTSVSVPAIEATTTDPVTVAGSNTTSITLLHTAVARSVVVTATPSGGMPVTLIASTDYTVGTDTSGNTTITFVNVPAAGTTISVAYTYVQQPATTITLDFSGLPAGTTSVAEIEGTASITVGGFASLSGDFAIEKVTPTSGSPVLVIGATNIDAVLGTADTNVTVTGASFGLLSQDGKYALLASAGTIALNGVPDLFVSATSLQVEVDNGFASVAGAPTSITTPGGSVDLSGLLSLISTNVNPTLEQIQVTGSISVVNFASLMGTFSFTETTAPDADNVGTTTMILVGASGVNAFLGANGFGVQISGASLGLVIDRDSEASGSTYALQATAPSIALVGLPTEVGLTGSATVAINTTGKAVNQTIPGVSQPVFFADGTSVESFGGSLSLTITPSAGTSFSLGGNFSFTKLVAGNISELLIGASGISVPSITADGGAGSFGLSNGTLGMVFYTNTTTNTGLGYALSASATATASLGNSSASGTLTVLRNTTTAADFPTGVSETVTVGATSIPLVFTASQEGTSTAAFQSIAISNIGLNVDNNLLITASVGMPTSPVPNASSQQLTGVTVTLQDPTSLTVLFTIGAGSAALTTFTGQANAGNGLSARQDGQPWETGDKDLLLTNVTFTIGTYVSFTAASIDLQHYTNASNATVDSFIFNTATLAILDNGQPLVSLTGSPTFDYTTNNGFSLDPLSTPFTGFKFLDPNITLGPITLVNPSVGLGNFSFAMSGQLTATVTVSAATATIGAGPVSATFTTLSGSVNLGLQFNLADLTQLPTILTPTGFAISAAALTVNLGTFVTLSATGTPANPLTIDPTAGANQNLISFATLSASLNVGAVSVTGTASNFAIEGDGSFLAEPNFGVAITLGPADSTGLGWPSFLPLQSASVSLVWPNFTAHPSNFVIELSAAINFSLIPGLTVSGSLTNVVIDPSLVAANAFPITSIGGLSVGISGNVFGGTVSGSLIAGVVSYDTKGGIVDGLGNFVGTTTPDPNGPFASAFFAGIEGGLSFGGMAGFNIRIGLSQFGPLQVYVEADVPIPLGDTGLFLSDFRGGITFGTSFPDILSSPPVVSDALKLGGPAFSSPDSLTAAQWQAQLEAQVVKQIHQGQTGGFTFPSSGPFIIQAGLTLYDVNPDVFNVTGDIFFDTSGKILVIGTATVGDSISVGAKVFTDLSPLFQGQKSLSILFLVQAPAQPNPEHLPAIYSLYGFVTFSDINNVFQITIAGEADFNVLNALKAEVTATLTLTFTSNSFNITLSNGTLTIPEIQSSPLGTADGSLTIENANGTAEIWGAFLLTTNLDALNPEGIFTSAQVFVKLNTTDVVQTVTLSNAPAPISLDPESFSLFINGVAEFEIDNQTIFELSGTLSLEISALSLSIFVQAQLLLGPDPNHPILAFNANGLIYVQLTPDTSDPTNPIDPGFAAKLALTLGAGVPSGITFGENWLLVMNTTLSTVTYTIPSPVPTNPPSPPVPTVLGPDYSSSNPLALTSYETITSTGARTLVIPAGGPPSGLMDYSNWSNSSPPISPDVYFVVLGRGSLTVANVFNLSGEINIDAQVTNSSLSFTLDVNSTMALTISGNTIFSFTATGAIDISNAGVAAVLTMQRSGGVPSSLGFNLTATYLLELNTTSSSVMLAGINLPKNQAEIQATGDLTLLGNVVDLHGAFDITVNSTSLTVGVTAAVTLLGASFTADGFAGIYYDAHPGLALNIDLSLPGGAQGIAPISALGSNFVISGAFDLEVNTCSVSRMDAAPGTTDSIAPGAEASVSNLGVYLYGFNLTGSISIGITDAGFNFTTSLNLDLFGFANIGITGYYYGPDNFNFTGTAGFQFGDHTFGIGGTISIDVSSNGFAASVSGWAAAFGLQISAFGSIAITGSSVDISVGFSVTIIPAVHINFDWVHINTNAVVISESATYHLGSTSPPPVVAPAAPPQPPPPTPPPLAGFVTDNSLNALELFVGVDASNRIDSAGTVTGAQNENYSLALVNSPSSSVGETIQVSALGQTQVFQNVQEILVNNTQTWNDIFTIDNTVAVPVNITLGSGNSTVAAGSGPATLGVQGGGNNQITGGAGSHITIAAAGNNVVTSGANSVITIAAGGAGSNQIATGKGSTISIDAAGGGNNQVTSGGAASVTIGGNENNAVSVNDSGGSDPTSIMITGTGGNTVNVNDGKPMITVAGTATGNNSVNVNTASFSTFLVNGGGSNSISTLGSGAAKITVNGNGNNQIATGGTAGGTVTNVYLVGSGGNLVSTGAGPANVYDQGTGGNIVSGGPGGGTDYYGVDGNGAAYDSKGSSYLTTATHNFNAIVTGYSNYVLASYGLAVGDFVTNQPVTTSASAIAPGTVVLTPAIMEPYITNGANLVINQGGPDQEFVTISAVTATTFTATFAQPHSANFTIGGIRNTYTLGLTGVPSVNMTAVSAVNSFTLEGWTGDATLTGNGGSNSLYSSPAAGVGGLSYVLSNSSLQVTGAVQQTISLNDIQTADLTGSGSGANSYDVTNWTGNGALTGQDNNNTLIATNDIANFTLSDTLFTRSGHGDFVLSGIQVANLTGGSSANTFTVNNWSGSAALDGKTGNNTFNITLPGFGTGAVTVANTGSTSADIDTLNVTAGRTTLVTTAAVRVGTQRVNYANSGIDVVNVIGGMAGLIFNVQSTSASVTSTTVRTVGNSNVINVGSMAGVLPVSPGILSQIQAPPHTRGRRAGLRQG